MIIVWLFPFFYTLQDIRLYFYNDTLYAFYVRNAPTILNNSLSLKYGKPKERIVNFSSGLLETAAIYEYDSADYLLESTKKTKNDITDIFYTWNEGNPFLECVLIESLYNNEKNKRDLDIIFYMKNKATAKIIEIKEQLQNEEDKDKRMKELEGL